MTASVLVYAVGGGHGHAMRGAVLRRRLRAHGHRVQLLVRPESARWLDEEIATDLEDALAKRHDAIVVDTFPRGWRGELEGVLDRFARRVLVSRYNRDLDFLDGAARYDRVINPYPAEHDEWDAPPPRATHVGWLVRPTPMRIDPSGDEVVILDPEARVPGSLLDTLSAHARRAGRSLRRILRMPPSLRAAKLVCVGAGYNTVYELARSQVDVRFVPLARRFDDQPRRAARVGRLAGSLPALAAWIAAPIDARPIARASSPSADPAWSLA